MKRRFLFNIIISLIFLVILIIILVDSGLDQRIASGIAFLPFYYYVIIPILVFYVTLTLHELGHLISFVIQGVKIRALYLTIFVFYKTKKGWRFSIKPKLWILFGGFVVPDIEPVENDESYNKNIKSFTNSLIAGPIVTIIVALLLIVTGLLVIMYAYNPVWIGIMTVATLVGTILSGVYLFTFFVSTDTIYGDFVAYQKMQDEKLFQFAQIEQYQMFSLKAKDFNQYMFEKAKDLLKKEKYFSNDIFLVMTLLTYLEGVIYHEQKSDQTIDEKIQKINVFSYSKNENGLMALYEICTYHYFQKRVEKAYDLFNNIQKRKFTKLDPKMLEYYKLRAEHILNIADHSDYLSDKKNIYTSNTWIFDGIYDPYEDLEKTHQKLPFLVYECDITKILEEAKDDKLDE